MINYISLNSKLLPADTAILTAANRGVKYGDALFETIKCVNGVPVFLEAHLKRLFDGMTFLEMNWTDQLLKTVVNEEIIRLLSRNRLKEGARVRLTVFRNDGGLYTPITNDVSVLIEAYEETNSYQLNTHGLSIGIFEDLFKPIHPLAAYKTANALLFVKAGLAKKRMNVNDLVILNSKGLVCETISSNIFMVIHNRLVTPPLSEGVLPGIMGQNVLLLANSLNMEVLETPIGVNAFQQAEEVFTTNAIHGAQWVMGFEKKRYFHKVSERINQELNLLVGIT